MNRGRGPGRDRRPPPDRKRSPPPRDRRRRSPPPRLRDRSPPRKRDAFARPAADVQVVILGTKQRRYGDQCAEEIRAAGFWVETRYLEGQRLRDVIGQAEKEASSYLVIVGIDNEQDKNVSFKILDSNQPPISRVSIKRAIDLIMEHDRRRRRPLRYFGEPPPVVTHRAFSPPPPDRRLPSPDRRPLHRLSPPPRRLRSRSPPFRSSSYGQPPSPHYPQDRLPIDRDRLPLDRDRLPIERDGYQRPPLHMMDDRIFMRRSSRDLSPVRGKKVYEPAYGQVYDRPPYYEHGYDARPGPAPRDYMQMPPPILDPGYPRTGQYGPMGVPQRSPPRHPSAAAQAAGIDDAAVSELLETLEDIDKAAIPAGFPIGNGHSASVGRPYPSEAYDLRGPPLPYRR